MWYQGGNKVLDEPKIYLDGSYKDFGYGFYCTNFEKQAKRWALTKKNKHVVEGPMADDTIWNYVDDFARGMISRTAFWELVKFKYPTHQIVFCTKAALKCLEYVRSYEL